MIDTTYTTLYKRPEAVYGVDMDITHNVDLFGMGNAVMFVSHFGKSVIAAEFVCKDSGIGGYILLNQGHKCLGFNIGDSSSNNPIIPLHNASHDSLATSTTTTLALPSTAEVGFIGFHFARQFSTILTKKCANLLEHAPRCLVGYASLTLNLFSRDTTPSRTHAIDSLKPSLERCSRLVKDSASSRINLSTAIVALIARSTVNLVMLRNSLAFHTGNPIRPAMLFNPFEAFIIVWELSFKVFHRVLSHLLNPFLHVLYHKRYMLSRDNYLIL